MRIDSLETTIRERRLVAVQEASHAVLITRFGGLAQRSIWPNASSDPNQRSWVGTCEAYVMPGRIKPHRLLPHVERPPHDWKVIVGLAGVAGEIYYEKLDSDAALFELQAFLDVEELSPTDAALIAQEVSTVNMERTIEHVVKYWADIVLEADRLERLAHLT